MRDYRVTDPDKLNALMEFDHPIYVKEGVATDVHPSLKDVYPPYYYEAELQDDSWEEFSYGYTWQYGVANPMHNSEFIGGQLAKDILDTDGIYVALVCYWDCDENCENIGECHDSPHAEGWCVARLKGSEDL